MPIQIGWQGSVEFNLTKYLSLVVVGTRFGLLFLLVLLQDDALLFLNNIVANQTRLVHSLHLVCLRVNFVSLFTSDSISEGDALLFFISPPLSSGLLNLMVVFVVTGSRDIVSLSFHKVVSRGCDSSFFLLVPLHLVPTCLVSSMRSRQRILQVRFIF